MTQKRIALIGGAGFIGHHIALELVSRAYEPHVIDSFKVNNVLAFYSSQNTTQNKNFSIYILNQRLKLLMESSVPLYVVDATDRHHLWEVLESINPDIIIFLAAVAHADRSNIYPLLSYDSSLHTLENALEFSKNRIEHFIFFSSSMVYGDFLQESVKESDVCKPKGIYGTLKYLGEQLIYVYNQVFSLPYTIIRPSALYGPRCVSGRVIQMFIERALAEESFSIKGDGSERLDFTYIDDLVQGTIKVIESENSRNEIFNITYGKSRSINDVLLIMQKYFPNVEINYLPSDKLMPKRGTLCVDKARELLGYSPQYHLEQGCEKYIEWYKAIWKKWIVDDKQLIANVA